MLKPNSKWLKICSLGISFLLCMTALYPIYSLYSSKSGNNGEVVNQTSKSIDFKVTKCHSRMVLFAESVEQEEEDRKRVNCFPLSYFQGCRIAISEGSINLKANNRCLDTKQKRQTPLYIVFCNLKVYS